MPLSIIAASVLLLVTLARDMAIIALGVPAVYELDPTIFFILNWSGTLMVCIVLLALLHDYIKSRETG